MPPFFSTHSFMRSAIPFPTNLNPLGYLLTAFTQRFPNTSKESPGFSAFLHDHTTPHKATQRAKMNDDETRNML